MPHEIKLLFVDKIHQFLDDWQHPSLRVKRLQGTDGVWEASLNMNIRFTFEFTEDPDGIKVCVLLNIGDHDHVLRPPY